MNTILLRCTGILISIGLLLCISVATSAQSLFNAGAHTVYGVRISRPGIGANASLSLEKDVKIAASLAHYFMTAALITHKTYLWEANIDANLYFVDEPRFTMYGIVGANYTQASNGLDLSGDFDLFMRKIGVRHEVGNNGVIGINLGVGADVVIPNFPLLYMEVKSFQRANQLTLAAGVRFPI